MYSTTTRSALLPTRTSTQGAVNALLDAGSPRFTISTVLGGRAGAGGRMSVAPWALSRTSQLPNTVHPLPQSPLHAPLHSQPFECLQPHLAGNVALR